MTTVDYSDKNNELATVQEMYQIPKNEVNPFITVLDKEQEIVNHIKSIGGEVKSINSETISKRRFKRRRAKELKRLSKRYNVVL